METDSILLSWDFPVLISLMIIWVMYQLLTGTYRSKFKGSKPATAKQRLFFLSAIFLLFIFEASPINMVGHYLFSVHMIQMSFLYLVIPPLLLLGIPEWLLRSFIRGAGFHRVVSFLTKPLIALLLFNGLISFYHLPSIFDRIMENAGLMFAYDVLLFGAAIIMWLPLIAPLPEYDRMSDLMKIGYVFANGILLTPACALLAFSQDPLYASYVDAPRLFGVGIMDDQQSGGVGMKIIQEISYGIVITFLFFRWFKENRKKAEQDDVKRMEAVKNGLSARNI